MLQYLEGDILASNAQALVNTVNTVGVMGKGIALQFKEKFPDNFSIYAKACKEKQVTIGKMLVVELGSLLYNKKTIINFPTKTDWRKPSEYIYIEQGLQDLVRLINERQIKSIAIPPLGAGNGGLDWNKVRVLMEKYLANLSCNVYVYQPTKIIQEQLKKERASLTPARAMLLSVLFDLVRNEEFVSEFAAEKISYFLQRFGAQDSFNLVFQPNFYGPYSGKVRRVLYVLNGSYITGYSSMDKKPFEELGLVMDAENDVSLYLNKNENLKYNEIAAKTKSFLSGFYSSFGLELLSTIDYIAQQEKDTSPLNIETKLTNWSNRKRTLFSDPRFINLSLDKLKNSGLLQS